MNQSKIIYKDESYQIQGAIFDVYREMGPYTKTTFLLYGPILDG